MEISQNTLQTPSQYLPTPGRESCKDCQQPAQTSSVESYRYNRVSVSYQLSLSGQQNAQLTYSREQLSVNYSSSTATATENVEAVEEAPERLAGAQTILDFISQRIASEAAQGATVEELTELLEQGLAGFLQGYNEARDILQGSGDLSGNVDETVTVLYNQVLGGLRELAEQFELTVDIPADDIVEAIEPEKSAAIQISAPPVTVENPIQALKTLNSKPQGQLKTLMDSLDAVEAAREMQVSYARKDRFSFSLTTQDGDKVQIKASAMSAYYGNYQANENGEQLVDGLKEKNHFQFKVDGDLDEGEQRAINDLLSQVFALADEFYNGDVDKAYAAALELGYDDNEIASYSLKLRQTVQASVAVAYPQAETVAAEDAELFNTIGDFTRDVLNGLTQPENYQTFDYTTLLESISQQIDEQVQPADYGFNRAIESLVDYLQTIGFLPNVTASE